MGTVFELNDMVSLAACGPRLAVLGDPVAHSLSPHMHGAALTAMASAHPELAAWRYEAVRVSAGDLEQALPLLRAHGFIGLNLTIPHKVDALGLINEADALSLRMGAVNTLIADGEGWRGTNTDGFGILKGIHAGLGCAVAGRPVWVFGAGGAARGILIALLEAGAGPIRILNRNRARLDEFASQTDARFSPPQRAMVEFCCSDDQLGRAESGTLFINATSLGLKADDPSPIAAELMPDDAQVYDTTYGVDNALARVCRARGIPYASGLSMLVWQGVRSLEIWTGHAVPHEVMLEAAQRELERRTSHD